jgi:hypothetical protein
LMALELQTSEQREKAIRSLSVQLSHGALSDSLLEHKSEDSSTTTPAELEGHSASGLLSAFSHGDVRDMVNAVLAEQTDLKGMLIKIANNAASESMQIAAIKSIDAMNGKMLTILQSTGVLPKASDEHQIDQVVAGWAERDRRELMYECMQADMQAAHLITKAFEAGHSGDLETAKKLFAKAEDRVDQWAKKKMLEELSELMQVGTETGPLTSQGQRQSKCNGSVRSPLFYETS